ncbi:hypothetical protein AGR7B_pAt0058 [Agrobacterium deltaense RV3]|nr:hypothetical protein AGR7B_pAt0058 [Agrobacterium deltaense RV3]
MREPNRNSLSDAASRSRDKGYVSGEIKQL